AGAVCRRHDLRRGVEPGARVSGEAGVETAGGVLHGSGRLLHHQAGARSSVMSSMGRGDLVWVDQPRAHGPGNNATRPGTVRPAHGRDVGVSVSPAAWPRGWSTRAG